MILRLLGLDPNNDKIIEIAAIRFKHGEITDRFVSLVNPEFDIPHLITEITGISNSMVFKAPKEAEIVDSFLTFLGDSPLVAHNIHFDEQFLSNLCLRHNKEERVMLENTIHSSYQGVCYLNSLCLIYPLYQIFMVCLLKMHTERKMTLKILD